MGSYNANVYMKQGADAQVIADGGYIYFGSDEDIIWDYDADNSKITLNPKTDDAYSFEIGDGTYDMDVKVFLGASTKYVLFDVGNTLLTLEDVDLRLGDNDVLQFGDGSDVTITWNGTLLQISPATDDTGSINIGNGTKDLDVKIFCGAATDYVLFDVGNGIIDSQVFLQFKTAKGIRTTTSDNEYLDIMAYDVDGTAYTSVIRVQNANEVELGFFGVTPVPQQSHIADSSGDDATAVNAILDVLEAFGLVATS